MKGDAITDNGGMMSVDASYEPRIVGFLCNWCSYAGADKAGASQLPVPPGVSLVRVMCSGRVDPAFVLKAFTMGADGVVILGCHLGECHYKEGNYKAAARHGMLIRLLEQFGIGKERCVFGEVSSGEAGKFVKLIGDTSDKLREMGPLSLDRRASTPGGGD